MLEYVALGLGAAAGVTLHLYERKLEKNSLRAGEENKRAFEKLSYEDIDKIADLYKKQEMSKLVNCLHNYLALRIKAEEI